MRFLACVGWKSTVGFVLPHAGGAEPLASQSQGLPGRRRLVPAVEAEAARVPGPPLRGVPPGAARHRHATLRGGAQRGGGVDEQGQRGRAHGAGASVGRRRGCV